MRNITLTVLLAILFAGRCFGDQLSDADKEAYKDYTIGQLTPEYGYYTQSFLYPAITSDGATVDVTGSVMTIRGSDGMTVVCTLFSNPKDGKGCAITKQGWF